MRKTLTAVAAFVANALTTSIQVADELPFRVGYDRAGAWEVIDRPPSEPRILKEPRPLDLPGQLQVSAPLNASAPLNVPIIPAPSQLPEEPARAPPLPSPSLAAELTLDESNSPVPTEFSSAVGTSVTATNDNSFDNAVRSLDRSSSYGTSETAATLDSAYHVPSLWDREKLTGDWWGWRTCAADRGITFDLMATQYYQGIAAGGLVDTFRFGGKFDGYVHVDGGKVGLWNGSYVTMHAESQFGDDVNPYDGAIVPNNFAIMFPQPGGHATAITALKFTQTVGDHLAVFGGRMNILDEYQNPFAAGYGRDRFMNSAFVLPPMFYPAISYSYLGAGFAVIKDNEPVLIVKVLDPSARPTRAGFDTLFENGASILTIAKLPVRPMGLLGHHGVGIAWNGGTYDPPYASDWTPAPAPPLGLGPQSGVWNILYGYDQELWVDSENPARKFGLFAQSALSDGRPNVYRWFFTAGVSGTSFLSSRPSDTWGCGYYLTGISGDLREASLDTGYPMGNEQGVELYYNIAVSRWCHVTPDLQILDPARQDADTTLVFGIRAKIDF